MKQYNVLLKKDNGTTETVIIEANNENDARYEGKKMTGVYEAVVLGLHDAPVHPHAEKGYLNLNSALTEAKDVSHD